MSQQCSGKSYQTGERCRSYALSGRERCRYHSGMVAEGQLAVMANDRTKFLKNLPTNMRPAFLESFNDPNQTSCSTHISLLDARIAELTQELEFTSEEGLTFKELNTLITKYLLVMDDPKQAPAQMGVIAEYTRKGQDRLHLWAQLNIALEMRRKMSETETKRDIALNQTIPKMAVVDVLSNLCHAFRRNVQMYAERELSNKILSKTSRELSRIIATGGLGILMSGGGPDLARGDGESGEPVDIEIDDIFD